MEVTRKQEQVAVYCRVSTERETQIHSYETQVQFFNQLIAEKRHWMLQKIYADAGQSGTAATKREAFQAMIEDAKQGKFTLLLTKEVSRFSRNILDAIFYARMLAQLGVGVIFYSDGIDTRQPDAELRLSILASLAQEESRKISERVKWGQRRKMEQGVTFGRSMLGYDLIGGTLQINPDGAAVVRRIFYAYAVQKQSARAICLALQRDGIRTTRGSEIWRPSHLIKILHNEKYMGDLLQKKTYTKDYLSHKKCCNYDAEPKILLPNHHPAIIEPALWNLAQEEIERRRKRSRKNPAVPISVSTACSSGNGME